MTNAILFMWCCIGILLFTAIGSSKKGERARAAVWAGGAWAGVLFIMLAVARFL